MEDDSFAQEEKSHNAGDWDQFAGNAHLISGRSTYNELLYTTPIPENVPEYWTRRAIMIDGEKPTPDTGKVTDNEETNHSLVIRTNMTQPQANPDTNASPATKTPKRKTPNSTPQYTIQRECPAAGCTWKTPPHGGQWQAFYNHVAHRHGKNISTDWWEKEGRFLCKDCIRHYDKSKQISHLKHCKGRNQPVRSLTPPMPTSFSEKINEEHPADPLPLLSSVYSLPLSTCKDVPHCCRFLWARILSEALTSAVKENTVQAWTLLAMLPKCVLPAPYRGGRKGHTSYSTYVEKRMELWLGGDYLLLWDQALKDGERKRSKSRNPESDEDRAAIRAELLVRQGEFSRGMAALSAAPMAPDNEETLAKLLEKHPEPHENPLEEDLPPIKGAPLQLQEAEVRNAVQSFHRGSSAGTMGLRPEHLQSAILEHEDKNVSPLSALTRLVNHLLEGKAPPEVQQSYAGARLCALEKGEDDVRPIAAGETLRRLVSKAACLAVKEKAGTLFRGRQYGVAASAGSERVIHLCRKTMLNNMGSDKLVFCKVDLRNAFNNVSRPVFALLTRLHFPELSPWVEWCYSSPSCLTYGNNFIPSAEGVQQGDPLGPLLFSLVLSEVTEEIASRSNLDSQLWYLDDGVLMGEAVEVRKAVDVFSEVGPRCGLFLNPAKSEIITPPASAHLTTLFPEIPKAKIRHDGNFDILGSPIGSDEHCAEFLMQHAIDPARETLAAIGLIGDPQVASALIRQCTGFCQMVYALRTTPPQALTHLCFLLDDSVMTAVEWALFPLDPPARDQILRRKRHGGFGLRSSTLHATAAYVSSVAHAADMDDWDPLEAQGFTTSVQDVNDKAGAALVDPCTGRTPKQNNPRTDSDLRHSVSSQTKRPRRTQNKKGSEKTAEPEMIIPRQQQLSQVISQQEFNTAYEKADPRTRARWISESGKGAGSWAFVTPSRTKGYAFTPTEFRTLSRGWLGMDVYPEDRP